AGATAGWWRHFRVFGGDVVREAVEVLLQDPTHAASHGSVKDALANPGSELDAPYQECRPRTIGLFARRQLDRPQAITDRIAFAVAEVAQGLPVDDLLGDCRLAVQAVRRGPD